MGKGIRPSRSWGAGGNELGGKASSTRCVWLSPQLVPGPLERLRGLERWRTHRGQGGGAGGGSSPADAGVDVRGDRDLERRQSLWRQSTLARAQLRKLSGPSSHPSDLAVCSNSNLTLKSPGTPQNAPPERNSRALALWSRLCLGLQSFFGALLLELVYVPAS